LNKDSLDNGKAKPKVEKPQSIGQSSKLKTQTWLLAAIYTCSFGITELTLYYLSVSGGVALYFAILIALVLNSAIDRNEANRSLWLALGLVPLIRIISTVTSAIKLAPLTWYILVGVTVFMGIYFVARQLKYSFYDIGINKRHLLWQILTAITGIGLGMIDYQILRPKPLIEGSSIQLIFPALVLLIFGGLMVELTFRGVMQRAAGALGSWGWVVIVPVYALLQIGYGSLMQILFALAVALFFGFVVLRTKSILGVSLAHGALNIMLLLVMAKIV
jgi:membrane protease YdiL (CAAX protease family)